MTDIPASQLRPGMRVQQFWRCSCGARLDWIVELSSHADEGDPAHVIEERYELMD